MTLSRYKRHRVITRWRETYLKNSVSIFFFSKPVVNTRLIGKIWRADVKYTPSHKYVSTPPTLHHVEQQIRLRVDVKTTSRVSTLQSVRSRRRGLCTQLYRHWTVFFFFFFVWLFESLFNRARGLEQSILLIKSRLEIK